MTDLSVPSTSQQDEFNSILPSTEKRRSTDRLDLGDNGEFRDFGHYMQIKAQKLMHQIHENVEQESQLFKGISFFVDGHTSKGFYRHANSFPDPPAAELRHLIIKNSGIWHSYFVSGETSYIIATALAFSKWRNKTVNKVYLRPEWIVDSLEKNRLLEVGPYLLQPNYVTDNQQQAQKSSIVEPFYQRSRLHLISTLAQELKKLVTTIRDAAAEHNFASWDKLKTLSEPENADFALAEAPIICHIDMDCFFVSVGLRTRPELRNKPVVVTHATSSNPNGHADIASCSYEARKFQISNGMWISNAIKRCSDLVCIPYEFENYRAVSKLLYTVVSRYTLDIKAVSCDELYLDLTNLCTELRISDPSRVVQIIRAEIFAETQCPASAGDSELVARLATRRAKPNGQFYLKRQDVNGFIKEIPLMQIPGIGNALLDRLQKTFGHVTYCKDLYSAPLSRLQMVLGTKQGKKIYDSIRGISSKGLTMVEKTSSVSCDVNFGVRLKTMDDLEILLKDICNQITKKLANNELVASKIALRLLIRCPDAPVEPLKYGAHGPCNVVHRSSQLRHKTNRMEVIFDEIRHLVHCLKPEFTDIRGVGLQLTKLEPAKDKDTSIDKVGERLKAAPTTGEERVLRLSRQMMKKARNKLSKRQRFLTARAVATLPELRCRCICGGQHMISVDIAQPPTFDQLLMLHCFFYNLVSQDECFEARSQYLKLYNYVKSDESEMRAIWAEALEDIRGEINRESRRRFQMVTVPLTLL